MSDDLVERIREGIMDGWSGDYPCLDGVIAQEAADRIEALEMSIQDMREALDRQCDNMAFIVNHVGIPNAWLEKFMRELEEDRKTLSKAKSQQEGETE